jgi:hypothetical protein
MPLPNLLEVYSAFKISTTLSSPPPIDHSQLHVYGLTQEM